MKKIYILPVLVIGFLLIPSSPALAVYVNGYYRTDGTYVNGYYKSDDENVTVYARNQTNGTGSYYLVIPRGNSSSCTWTYAGGSGYVPYSVNTQAQSWPNASEPGQGPMQPQGIEFYNSTISSYYDFKVTCVNDFGERFIGVFPQDQATQDIQEDLDTYRAGQAATSTSEPVSGGDTATTSALIAPYTSDTPQDSKSNDWNWLWGLGFFFVVTFLINKFKNSGPSKSDNGTKQKTNTNSESEIPPTQNSSRRSANDPELKSLYREVMKKYHPDFAQSDTDKDFRTKLTAKITKAYNEGDIETLRMFQ